MLRPFFTIQPARFPPNLHWQKTLASTPLAPQLKNPPWVPTACPSRARLLYLAVKAHPSLLISAMAESHFYPFACAFPSPDCPFPFSLGTWPYLSLKI